MKKSKWSSSKTLPEENPSNVVEFETDDHYICDGWFCEGKFYVRSMFKEHEFMQKQIIRWRYTGKNW